MSAHHRDSVHHDGHVGVGAPGIVVVMGVSGAGKTTVGQRLAERAGWAFRDADDFHPPANIAKMRRGEALTDTDRAPWLEELHALLSGTAAAGHSLVLACSALKAAFRSRLTEDIPGVNVVYLRVHRDELQRRLSVRSEHFFPGSLLDSQLAALEEPTDAVVVDGVALPETIVTTILDRLGTAGRSS
jgi:carbohydrate kinase (thermoresistant glucokinase family)